jgi:DNA transformation protein and related proteins
MAIGKDKPDAGKGGKLGRSNMAYWGTNDEAKEDGRKRRRRADRDALHEGLADLADAGSMAAYVFDQLSALRGLEMRRMFGGVGFYLDGRFFAILFKDRLYFRVSKETIGEYKTRGMKPFAPFKNKAKSRNYYEVPVEVLESPVFLVNWAKAAARSRGTGRA